LEHLTSTHKKNRTLTLAEKAVQKYFLAVNFCLQITHHSDQTVKVRKKNSRYNQDTLAKNCNNGLQKQF
jgi:hypothetical protein